MKTPHFQPTSGVNIQPPQLPPRSDVVAAMLKATGRGGVPLRSAFIQSKTKDQKGSRQGPLAKFTTDARALDAYLLIHALASSKAPHSAMYPALTWSRAANFDVAATSLSAKQRWSKAVGKLTKSNLVTAGRAPGSRGSVYTLLHESGNGTEYTRPTKISEGGWVTLPHAYWLQDWDQKLSLPEKLMLLISLDQKAEFRLPAARAEKWYGVSESTAKRGLRGLVDRKILTSYLETELDLQNPMTLIRQVNVYSTAGIWTLSSRKKAMTIKRPTGAATKLIPSP